MTDRLLRSQHGARMGNLGRVAAYLDEMKAFRIPLHGAIFLVLFKGFQKHGGYACTPWSEQRLRGIWAAFLHAYDSGQSPGLEIDVWLARWVLRAFARCSKRRAVEDAYDELKSRWALAAADEQDMIEFLASVLRKK